MKCTVRRMLEQIHDFLGFGEYLRTFVNDDTLFKC